MNLIKKLAGQTAVYGLSSIIGRLLNYLLVPLYTRVFLPEEYGVVTELYAYVGFMIVIFTYGLETAFFRFSEERKDPEKTFSTALGSIIISSVLMIVILVLISDKLANVLSYSDKKEYLIWLSCILGLDAISAIPFAWLRQKQKAFSFALLKFINIAVTIGLNIFFLVLCPLILNASFFSWAHPFILNIYNPAMGVGYIFIANLAASCLNVVLLLPVMMKATISIELSLLKSMLLYSLPLLIAGLAGAINELLDRTLLKHLLPYESHVNMVQIGIYGACYKLSILMTLFIQAFRFAAEPFFFSHYGKKNDKESYAVIMKYFVICTTLIFLGVLLYMDFIKHFIGSKYHSGLKVVPILLFANLLLGVYFNLSIWYKLKNKTIYGAYIAIGGAVITIVLNICWIPVFGFMGSAWATLICYAVMVIVSYTLGQINFPVPYDIKRIIFYLALSVGFYILSDTLITDHLGQYNFIKVAANSGLFFLYIIIIYLIENTNKRLIR